MTPPATKLCTAGSNTSTAHIVQQTFLATTIVRERKQPAAALCLLTTCKAILLSKYMCRGYGYCSQGLPFSCDDGSDVASSEFSHWSESPMLQTLIPMAVQPLSRQRRVMSVSERCKLQCTDETPDGRYPCRSNRLGARNRDGTMGPSITLHAS